MGNTTVICGVKAEIAEPDLDREEEGFLGDYRCLFFLEPARSDSFMRMPIVPNVDLPAMCSAKFKPGPPSEDAQVLSDRLNETLISLVALVFLCLSA